MKNEKLDVFNIYILAYASCPKQSDAVHLFSNALLVPLVHGTLQQQYRPTNISDIPIHLQFTVNFVKSSQRNLLNVIFHS